MAEAKAVVVIAPEVSVWISWVTLAKEAYSLGIREAIK